MEYKLLDHDEYSHPDHPPAESVGVGDHVVLVFRSLQDYQVTEARAARVVAEELDSFVAELLEPGMIIAVAAGERLSFNLRQAFQPAPFGDETLLSVPGM